MKSNFEASAKSRLRACVCIAPFALLATTCLSASPAAAQQSEPEALGPTATEAVADGGEIIVTAQRRSERLSQVPISVTALSGDQLALAGITDTKQLSQMAPGFNFSQGSYAPQPTIRGVGSRSNNPGDESVVPVYIDGVYQSFLNGTAFELNNVERIEVLRGPQGTLLGRNATGGAINIITRRPGPDPRLEVVGSFGRFDERRLQAYASVGLADFLAADVSGLLLRDDGYVRDVGSVERLAKKRADHIRAKALFTPSDDFEYSLAYTHVYATDNTALSVQPVNGNTRAKLNNPALVVPTDPYQSDLSFVPFMRVKQDSVSGVGTWHGQGFDIQSFTGFQKSRLHFRSDSDGARPNTAFADAVQLDKAFTQEVILTTTGSGPLNFIGGIAYLHSEAKADPLLSATASLESAVTTDSYAAYGQIDWKLAEPLTLSVGGRYTSEDKDYIVSQRAIATGMITSAAGDASFRKFTPSVTISYRPGPETNLYAKYSEAFKPGVFNTYSVSSVATRPETIEAFEVGVKARPLPWLRAEVSAYHYMYEDLQVTAREPTTNTTILQNAASAEFYGGELNLSARLGALNLNAGAAYTHARYKDFPGAQVTIPLPGNTGNSTAFIDASGKKVVKTPEFTFNIGGSYRIESASGEFTLSSNLYHAGRYYWDVPNRLSQSPVTLLNAEVAWTEPKRRFRVAIFGNNLLDETYQLSLTTSSAGDIRSFARPATYGVRLSLFLD